MSDIPSELHQGLLLRLPVDSLLRFRSVCKKWLRIIDDPAFIKSHLDHQFSSAAPLIVRNHMGTRLYSVSFGSDSCSVGSRTIDVTPLKPSDDLHGLPLLPVSSCDGLILISHHDSNMSWAIWNPFTRDYHKLPLCKIGQRLGEKHFWCCGIGYDCAGDDYKVVRVEQIYSLRDRTWENKTFVYSLKMNSWKSIETNHPLSNSWIRGKAVYLNGSLHWISTLRENKEIQQIAALYLGTENFSVIQFPSEVSNSKEHILIKNFDTLGGCLFLGCSYSMKCLDGWLMKDYGVKNSWTKLFSLTQLDVIDAVIEPTPLAYLRSEGQILFQHVGQEFFWFDVEKKTVKRIRVHGFQESFSSQICPGSLVRLNNSGGVAKNITGGKKDWTNERLKLSLTTTDGLEANNC